MHHVVLRRVVIAGMCALPFVQSLAQPPKRDLTIELREVEDAASVGYSAGTRPRQAMLAPQQLLVRNGEKALLKLSQSYPVQWVQSVQAQSANLTASGVAASSNNSGVTNALTWLEAGHSVSFKPLWPGGKQAVTVEVEVQTQAVDDDAGAALPAQLRSHYATTVSAPLGYWVVIATTGKSPQAGSYSSEPSRDVRRLLQIRVSAN